MRSIPLLSSLTLLALVAGAAHAGEVVIHGPEAPDPTTERRVRSLTTGEIDRWVPISELSQGVLIPVRLYGVAEQVSCEHAPMPAVAVQRLLAEAELALDTLSLDGSREIFDRTTPALCCASEIIPAETLTDLFFFRGMLAVYSGDTHQAQQDFRQALAVAPDREWDPTYPPEAFQIYLHAMEQHYLADPVPLGLLAAEGEVIEAYVDGAAIDPAVPLALPKGWHFLQFRARDGQVVTFQFKVEGEEHLVLASDDGLAVAILEGVEEPQFAWAVQQRLREVADQFGVDAVQVATGDVVYRYDKAADALDVLWQPPDRHRTAHQAGVALTISGSAAAVVGLLVAGAAYGAAEHPAHWNYHGDFGANRFGFGLAITGGVMAAIGLPLAITNRPARARRVEATPTVAISGTMADGRWSVGVTGRW